MTERSAYERLKARFGLAATIGECASMLNWDAAAVMPPGGAAARGDQLALLAVLRHQHLTAPEVADDLAAATTDNAWDAANLRLMQRMYRRARALPASLVEAQTKAASACEKVWRVARQRADYALVRPHLAEVVRLTRDSAAALGEALGLTPYDALMDEHQHGIGAADVEPIFAAYETFLAETLPAVERRQAAEPAPVRPQGPFPVVAQQRLCRAIAEGLGLDFDHARLDESAHPFSGGTPADVRITTRYAEDDCTQAILAVVHETGHALYERGLPAAYARQPVGEAAGMAVHESQSLIVEMQAFRSDPFLSWLGGRLHETFGGDPACYRLENLGRLWRHVARGTIRVDADEVTYPAHVILRFRLEQALVSGQLDVADLPGAWNDGLKALLGITPPNDAEGCLQDIHWYDGAFGYFPSYTLGAMSAAQLMQAAREQVAGLDEAFSRGDLSPLLAWLRVHVHQVGSSLGMNAILQRATGRPLDPLAFQTHLRRRYLGCD
ncbi:carboxypeptidase M32 [Rhodopila globiformis]|uniref:Metal-dependent carboxypeptidase n=1 Tax=Rhodopila globiformis TaxID=1071 RepID=A0A2S6NKQ0_RHOGL|nr:carboxypeptidase M32 [Rhodopila globiformis]PPQ35617.1 carboxypeptidase M32 [Rhodopila globiformis]